MSGAVERVRPKMMRRLRWGSALRRGSLALTGALRARSQVRGKRRRPDTRKEEPNHGARLPRKSDE